LTKCRDHFLIKSQRIIDNVPHVIDKSLFWHISENIGTTIQQELGLVGADAMSKAQAYLAERPEVTAKRAELLDRKARIDRIARRLNEF
jgi:vacuolar protein sorting-associated protein 1